MSHTNTRNTCGAVALGAVGLLALSGTASADQVSLYTVPAAGVAPVAAGVQPAAGAVRPATAPVAASESGSDVRSGLLGFAAGSSLVISLAGLGLAVKSLMAPKKPEQRFAMAAFEVQDMPGVAGFPGFFDPLGLSEGKSEAQIKKFREAELKHGRVAMLGALGFLTAEVWNPLFDGKIMGASLYHFQQADNLNPLFWVWVSMVIGWVEVGNIQIGWEDTAGTNKIIADLKEDYTPGDLGFDPLGLKPSDPEEYKLMATRELNNGRLAMLSAAGMIAQELKSGQSLFDFWSTLAKESASFQ